MTDDLRLAIRTLRATPIVATIAVLSLALGIGANTAFFSLVNSLLLRALPVEEPERLFTITSDTAIRLGFPAGGGWNYDMWQRLQQRADAFDGAFAFSARRFDLAQGGERELVDGLYASGGFFETLGVPALIGRTFTPRDDVRGAGPDGPVAVISYGLWQRRFGGSATVLGTTLTVDGVPFTIVGVTPPEFFGVEVGRVFDVILPLGAEHLVRGKDAALNQPRNLYLIVMVRLKLEQSVEAGIAALRAMQPAILGITPEELPRFRPDFLREPFTLAAASGGTSGTAGPGLRQRYERPLLTIFVVVALVLFIACANIANLLLARATARRHELSVRLALGAPRWRLARQLLVESLVLSSLGALAGLALAAWGSRALVAQLSTSDARVFFDQPLDWRVLGFTAAAAITTAILFGTAPAVRATRVSPIDALKDQGRTAGSGHLGLSSTLVVAQVALSLVLVVAAGLFVRTFASLASVPLGFDRDRVLVFNVNTARAHLDPKTRNAFYHRLVDVAAAAPGVDRVAASMWTPVSNGGAFLGVDRPGEPQRSDAERRVIGNFVTPGWFAAYGTPIRGGRDFDQRDTASGAPVAIVNEIFARTFFPGRDAVGESILTDGSRTIVGVVGDSVFRSLRMTQGAGSAQLRDGAPPMVYLPLAQTAGREPPGRTEINISVRARPGSGQGADALPVLARTVSAALVAENRNLAFSVRALADYVNASLRQERLVALLSGFFGALALLLAGLGLYGVTAYGVSRRRNEIGIRMALGAEPAGVVRLILSRVLLLVGAGVIVGAAASAWLSRFVAPLLYGLEPRDPMALGVAVLALAAVGVLAGWLPARRASRVDPAQVLRNN